MKVAPQNNELKGSFVIVLKKRCYMIVLVDYNIILVLHIFDVVLKFWNWILDFRVQSQSNEQNKTLNHKEKPLKLDKYLCFSI
jgi:hypothetical protein